MYKTLKGYDFTNNIKYIKISPLFEIGGIMEAKSEYGN